MTNLRVFQCVRTLAQAAQHQQIYTLYSTGPVNDSHIRTHLISMLLSKHTLKNSLTPPLENTKFPSGKFLFSAVHMNYNGMVLNALFFLKTTAHFVKNNNLSHLYDRIPPKKSRNHESILVIELIRWAFEFGFG